MPNERANGTGPHPFPIGRPLSVGVAGGSAKLVADAPEGIDIPPGVTDRATPPIAVRCFGHFEVRHGDRLLEPATGERSTYKAWELLAFLSSSPPGPFARDTLLDRVWMDRPLNQHRPANALNQAVSRLRRALMAQVPGLPRDIVHVGRDGTYRLNERLVVSDTHHFLALADAWKRLPLEEALTAHREALALYRKELLTGSGYTWVDEAPEGAKKLSALYGAAARDFTCGLARRCVRERRHAQAAPLYRWLLDDEPTREDLARELYLVYGALGDRRALVRAHRALCQAVREDPDAADYDDATETCEPEEETEATYQRVLAELDATTSSRRVAANGRRAG